MNLGSSITNGFREIWANKFRTCLSMVGIVLGVAALVGMVGMVQGMMVRVRGSFEDSGGLRRLEVVDTQPPEEQQKKAFLSPGRTVDDYWALRQALPHVEGVYAGIRVGWSRLRYAGRHQHVPMYGVTAEAAHMSGLELKSGRFIGDLDVASAENVIVISEWAYVELFPDGGEAVGEVVTFRGRALTIIGLLKDPDGDPYNWWGREVYVPITCAMRRFEDGNERVSDLSVLVRDVADINSVIEQIHNVLTITHNQIEDFEAQTREEELEELQQLETSFVFTLGGVAAITLLVGGIGICNVMLAVINERIREIGVRKAVGARDFDVFFQFLAEAVMISFLGGVVGLCLSTGMIKALNAVGPGEMPPAILSPQAMLYGFGFSVLVGVAAGIYPAIKAARLDVIDALRTE
ncbi:MAG: ABC transporter permease [Opitutales bacterium]